MVKFLKYIMWVKCGSNSNIHEKNLCVNSFLVFHFPVNTIAVAKPEKARMIESMIINMARSGQLQGQKVRGFHILKVKYIFIKLN